MNDTTTADLTAQARALEPLDKARTQGEWSLEPRKHQQNQIVEPVEIGPMDAANRSICTVWKRNGKQDARPNAAFIAAAPRAFALLRQLCDRLEEVERDAASETAWLCERGDNGPTRFDLEHVSSTMLAGTLTFSRDKSGRYRSEFVELHWQMRIAARRPKDPP